MATGERPKKQARKSTSIAFASFRLFSDCCLASSCRVSRRIFFSIFRAQALTPKIDSACISEKPWPVPARAAFAPRWAPANRLCWFGSLIRLFSTISWSFFWGHFSGRFRTCWTVSFSPFWPSVFESFRTLGLLPFSCCHWVSLRMSSTLRKSELIHDGIFSDCLYNSGFQHNSSPASNLDGWWQPTAKKKWYSQILRLGDNLCRRYYQRNTFGLPSLQKCVVKCLAKFDLDFDLKFEISDGRNLVNLGGGLFYLPGKHWKFRGEFRGKFRNKFRRKLFRNFVSNFATFFCFRKLRSARGRC